MAKNKKNFDEFSEIQRIEREIQKRKKRIAVGCSHQNDKGKLKVEPINDHGDYKCKICKQEFNMAQFAESTLQEGVELLHSAIQQIRCFSDGEEDEKLVRLLGELDFNLQEIPELYEKVVLVYGKGAKKKKKNRGGGNNDNFGSYGGGQMSFLGGGGKRR